MVDGVTVTELEAGHHGLLEITYKAVPSTLPNQGGYGNTPPNEGTPVITENSGWTMRWGTYSRSVLEYCDVSADDLQGDEYAHADHVIKCSQLPKPRESQIPSSMSDPSEYPRQYLWIEPNQAGESVSADVRSLCDSTKERQIYNYYVRGVQPVFHYPILTYCYTYQFPLSCYSDLSADHLTIRGDKVDTICDPATDDDLKYCPMELSGWEWIDCGTECQERQQSQLDKGGTYQVTWTTTWEGCVKADKNFYSPVPAERWYPGGGTYASHQSQQQQTPGGQE